MKFVNLETGLEYELIAERDFDYVLFREGKHYSVTKPAFMYWYTTKELWELQNIIRESLAA